MGAVHRIAQRLEPDQPVNYLTAAEIVRLGLGDFSRMMAQKSPHDSPRLWASMASCSSCFVFMFMGGCRVWLTEIARGAWAWRYVRSAHPAWRRGPRIPGPSAATPKCNNRVRRTGCPANNVPPGGKSPARCRQGPTRENGSLDSTDTKPQFAPSDAASRGARGCRATGIAQSGFLRRRGVFMVRTLRLIAISSVQGCVAAERCEVAAARVLLGDLAGW